jgi:hypothetical protein
VEKESAGGKQESQFDSAVAKAAAKKKPAGESGLKTIFLEENSGDR